MTQSLPFLDRRAFLGGTTLTVGGALVAGLVPASLLAAAPVACRVDASLYPDACGDWQLDDICNAYPPYAFPAGAAPSVSVAYAGQMADADRHWIV